MNSKNITKAEREWMGMVKSLPCGCCGQSGISQAHHIEQGKHFLTIPLCESCHTNGFNGLHGQQRIWKVLKKTELSVLNDTIRLLAGSIADNH